ncbi:hypothetical protein CRV08_06140 [Halarcobacter ebronensis]|uniref:NodB homology domain-containing protein n=1 Tax=Halarcobacter ebronensis TaxID=1462615 RepID=A0A4Q0YIS6_9BACT|nr:polysaccharide deacetylase family protein [Halarcobacter ebronensis]RXJ69009.1 hypothetical protein CRV08_06140 [Halarcobacter ebronensis]
MKLKKTIKLILALLYYNLYGRYRKQVGNRVILYHSIGSELKHDSYGISISKERFFEHMKYLKSNFEIIPLDNNYFNSLNKETISITFDDGYKDNLYALHVCEEFQIPFTLYITTEMIGEKEYLTKEDILLFAKSPLCTLGTHSVTHPHLGNLDYKEQYDELYKSKMTLENIVGEKIVHMSYPHGSFNQDTLKLVEEIGYKYVSSSEIGKNTQNNLNYKMIKRVEIIASDNTKELFRKIAGYYDYLSLIHNKSCDK